MPGVGTLTAKTEAAGRRGAAGVVLVAHVQSVVDARQVAGLLEDLPAVLVLIAVLGCRLKASGEVVKEAVSLGEVVEAGEDVWGGTVGS